MKTLTNMMNKTIPLPVCIDSYIKGELNLILQPILIYKGEPSTIIKDIFLMHRFSCINYILYAYATTWSN